MKSSTAPPVSVSLPPSPLMSFPWVAWLDPVRLSAPASPKSSPSTGPEAVAKSFMSFRLSSKLPSVASVQVTVFVPPPVQLVVVTRLPAWRLITSVVSLTVTEPVAVVTVTLFASPASASNCTSVSVLVISISPAAEAAAGVSRKRATNAAASRGSRFMGGQAIAALRRHQG